MRKKKCSPKQWVALLFLAAVFLRGDAQANETPEALAQAYVQAKNASNPERLKAILHPEFIDFLLEQGPTALEEVLTRWAQGQAPTEYEIELIDISNFPAYHAETQQWEIGPGQVIYYPVAPELMLRFWVTSEAGERGAGETFAISSKAGRWYIVFSDV